MNKTRPIPSKKLYRTPEKAVILAAGLGERMRPLTTATPKAMLPFMGKPAIDHVISNLRTWGVRDVLINLHHAPAPLIKHFQNETFNDIKISFSFEPDICGTGGALRRAAWFIDDKPFWMVNSDIVFELNPSQIIQQFMNKRPLACLWVTKSAGPRTVEIQNSRITSFSSKTPGTPNTATFTGIHLISPDILQHLPDLPFSSIIEAYNSALKQHKHVLAVEEPLSYWADLGSPEKLLATHLDLLNPARKELKLHSAMQKHCIASKRTLRRKGAAVSGLISAGSGISARRGTVIHNSILGDNIQLGRQASVSNCIIAPDSAVNASVERAALPLSQALNNNDVKALLSKEYPVAQILAEALPPRGSDRSFYRLHMCSSSAILIKHTDARPENTRFCSNLRFLKKISFPAPDLLAELPCHRMCIVEDLGRTSLQNTFKTLSNTELTSIYSKVIASIALLHGKGTLRARKEHLDLEPPFDSKLYLWEHRLFAEHYLGNVLKLNNRSVHEVLKELSHISAKLQKTSAVLIHRDLQSSNIILKQNKPVFIDFQGMRFGPRFYDLASLLFDPYVSLDQNTTVEMMTKYASILGLNPASVIRMTKLAGIQRLAQALGAYGRLSRIEGMSSFKSHIKPAEKLLYSCLQETTMLPHLSAIIKKQLRD